jgi:uncharacterized protein YecE (DUF72 family)
MSYLVRGEDKGFCDVCQVLSGGNMEKSRAVIRVGLGGWEHEVFDQCFYPVPGMTSLEKLGYYAEFFSAVEVRATFWDGDLTHADAREWIEAVQENPAFRFGVKLHHEFTHKKTVRPELSRNVRGLLQELVRAGKLGSLIMQFPYSFTNTSSNRFHLIKLAEIFAGFPTHAELRHESWHEPGLIGFLQEHAMGIVSADIPRIRHYMPFVAGVSGSYGYLRLHGRNEKGWLLNAYDARYDYLYNERETREIVRRISALEGQCSNLTVICNNTTAGKAIPLAFHLLSAVRGGRQVPVPGSSLEAFPFIHAFSHTDAGPTTILHPALRAAV